MHPQSEFPVPVTPPKALFFDVFGTLVDWRTGVSREAERLLATHNKSTDWIAFADAWRGEYQPGMEEIRSCRQTFAKLDILHRRNLEKVLPRFGLANLPEDLLRELNLAWHKLDGWPDHGIPEPFAMKGGAYFQPDPAYYSGTFIKDFRTRDPEFEGKDILDAIRTEKAISDGTKGKLQAAIDSFAKSFA